MMRTSYTLRWIMIIALVLLLIVGCSLLYVNRQDQSSAAQKQTQDAAATLTAEFGASAGTQTETPVATKVVEQTQPQPDTGNPTPSISQTPDPEKPLVSVGANTICRTGPGRIYESVGVLQQGVQVEVVGRSEDMQYWIIKNPEGSGECWLWAYYAVVVGQTSGLPVYNVPATPTPTATATQTATPTPNFRWEGIWTVSTGSDGSGNFPEFPMNVSVDQKTFTASVDFMGNLVTYNGMISDDDFSVSGTWSDQSNSGPFRFYALGINQFQGDAAFGSKMSSICGARGGEKLPIPCVK